MYIFHVEKHYKFTWYKQCITFGTFENTAQELTYNMLGFIGMYAVPLLVIITCYAGILIELNKQTSNNKKVKSRNSSPQLRRSGTGNIGKAKIQTIKMTSVIVTAFVVCWTPYYVICLWHWFFKSSATKIDKKIQKILFIFAVSNSCLNPLVYGYFSVVSNARRKICSCFYPNNNSKRRSPEQSRTRPTFIRTTSNVNSANYTQPLDYTSILKTEDTCNKKDGIFTTPL
ncbi:GNRHR (predicted) [Pycnogonum litorale]